MTHYVSGGYNGPSYQHRSFLLAFAMAALALIGPASGQPKMAPEGEDVFKNVPGKGQHLIARIVTNQGSIRCRLFHRLTPKTTATFVGLATGQKAFLDSKTGQWIKRPLYVGSIFHRVIPNYMIQAGCPEGTGFGGPGFMVIDEFHKALRHDRPGVLSLANAGPNTGGSQFFITERAMPILDNRFTVFGHCANVDVIQKIARVPVFQTPKNKPMVDVKIQIIEFEWGTWSR